MKHAGRWALRIHSQDQKQTLIPHNVTNFNLVQHFQVVACKLRAVFLQEEFETWAVAVSFCFPAGSGRCTVTHRGLNPRHSAPSTPAHGRHSVASR